MKTILAVNCGSSSIKFKLYTIPTLDVLISGQASSVATKGAKPSIKYVVHSHGSDERNAEDEEENMPYEAVFERIVALIDQSTSKHFQPEDAIAAVSHRVVHGGTESEPMEIYPGHTEGLELLDKLSDFAPLHVRIHLPLSGSFLITGAHAMPANPFDNTHYFEKGISFESQDQFLRLHLTGYFKFGL